MEKKREYILDMFPYPSGYGLHVGHAIGYVSTDIYTRWLKLQGKECFHPFGFDSFGIPTEQYAEKVGRPPEEITKENIARFKSQLEILNLDLNWEAEIWTSSPKYWKWTQWIFLQLYNSWFNQETQKAEPIETCPFPDLDNWRLAYKAHSEVNWCEALKTVLSEDEIIDGKSERGGYPVEKKKMEQWFLRITAYRERLREGLKNVEWKGKSLQENWLDRLHDVVFSRQRKWGEPFPLEGEEGVMPAFAGSNWYFFRYLDPKNEEFFCDKEKQVDLPVDLYVGGAEHSTGHVLYARFITKVLYDLGHSLVDEPFKKIINVGILLGADGLKMSKSKGNAVVPDDVIEKYGVDAFRMWICFIGPFEQIKKWDDAGIKGCQRSLLKYKSLFERAEEIDSDSQRGLLEETKKGFDRDISSFSFNTAIPKFMKFVNSLFKEEKISKEVLDDSLRCFSPILVGLAKERDII